MKTKIKKWRIIPLLACILIIAYATPTKAQYLPDEYTVGLWHLDKEFGTALSFDGIDDYVQVAYSTSLDITGAVTIEAWVYARGSGEMLKIACKRETPVPFYFIGVDHGKLYAGIGGETSYVVTDKVTELPLNEWHHVAMVYSDAEDKIWLYLDGELKETVTCMIQLVTFPDDLIIGAQFYNGKYMQFFKGIIDEVRISNAPRTSFDLSKTITVDDYTVALWHFNEGSGVMAYDETAYDNDGYIYGATWVDSTLAIDSSSNENFGTIHGAAWADGNFEKALSFDGVDDYINIPDDLSLDITDDITLEAWFKIKRFTISEGYHMYILSKDTNNQRSYGIGVDLIWQRPQMPFFIVFDGTSYKVAWGANCLVQDTWYHIKGEFYASSGDLKLYIDGLLESTEASTMNSIYSGTADLWIGARQYSGHRCFFDGIIDEVHISNFAGIIPVNIDIKPGSFPNAINLGSHGLIPVAILSSEDFDATTVNPETVRLAGQNVAVRGKGNKLMAHEEDVNGDGKVDLVVQLETQNFTPESFQDGEAVLTGVTYSGRSIEGSDELTIVPPKK